MVLQTSGDNGDSRHLRLDGATSDVREDVTRHLEPPTQPRALNRKERAIEKKRVSDLEWAEKMKPRLCRLCKVEFAPTRRQDWDSTFCTAEHRKAFWKQAHQIAAGRMTAGEFFADANRKAADAADERKAEAAAVEYREGMTDIDRVFELLGKYAVNKWLDKPYDRYYSEYRRHVIWPTIVSQVRAKMGVRIDCRAVYSEKLKKNEYEYMLVVNPEGE